MSENSAAQVVVADLRKRMDSGDRVDAYFVEAVRTRMNGERLEALALFERAGQLGDVEAMVLAGRLCEEIGRRGSATYWFSAAAETGDARAAFDMAAYHYRTGDLDETRKWYERSAESGMAESYGALSQLADDAGDETAARSWALLGADAGDVFCMAQYAYYMLLAAQRDTDRFHSYLNTGLPYALRAAEKGDVAAMYSAGIISAGLGRTGARQWLERAAAAGHPNARNMISKLGLN